jgi:hypothetical protein
MVRSGSHVVKSSAHIQFTASSVYQREVNRRAAGVIGANARVCNIGFVWRGFPQHNLRLVRAKGIEYFEPTVFFCGMFGGNPQAGLSVTVNQANRLLVDLFTRYILVRGVGQIQHNIMGMLCDQNQRMCLCLHHTAKLTMNMAPVAPRQNPLMRLSPGMIALAPTWLPI